MSKEFKIPTVKGDLDDPRLKPWPDDVRWTGKPNPKDPDWRKYRDVMRARRKELAEYTANQQIALGIEFGIWRDTGPDYFKCSVAARNNGRKFRLAAPGDDGLPGSGKCCTSGGWCNCDWSTIIDGYHDPEKILWVKGGKKAAREYLEKEQEGRRVSSAPLEEPELHLDAAPQKRKPFWKTILGL